MYLWRKLSASERDQLLASRKERKQPWHSPPHRTGGTDFYHISAACYEHRPFIGHTPERMATFNDILLATVREVVPECYAWCVLPNHYHLLVFALDLEKTLRALGKMHGRISYEWNGEEHCRGRQVWHNAVDRSMRSERHFWATTNYIHHNPVHHRYVEKWTDWPYTSAHEYLETMGWDAERRIWEEYPVLDYGKGWDDPDL